MASISSLTDDRGTPRFASDIEHLATPVGDLRPHPENPRRGDVGAIAESLVRFGQVKPVLALPDGTLIAGHHVYYAARHLGWDRVAAVRVAMDEDRARAYLLADNRLSELGGYDPEALGALLSDVAGATGLEGTGYRDEDIKRFFDGLGGGGEGEGGRGRDPDNGTANERDTTVRCPMCGIPAE